MESAYSSHSYLVSVSSEEEERRCFELCEKRGLLAFPILARTRTPSPDLLEFWKVTTVESAEAASVAAGLTPPAPSASPSQEDVVVALEKYEREGRLYAAWTGRAFYSCRLAESLFDDLFAPLATRPSSVTVIGEISQLPYSFFSKMLETEHSSRGDSPSIGFLTGVSPEDVRWALLKSLTLWRGGASLANGDLFIIGSEDIAAPAMFEGIETLWWRDLAPERLLPALQGEYFFSALMSHSNGVDGDFSGAILCPVRAGIGMVERAPEAGVGVGGVPSCVYSSLCQRDPRNLRHRFHPHSIRSAISHYDTCAGFLTAGAFSLAEASLGTAFLSGTAAAHVTSIRKKAAGVYSALLFRSFLRDGYPLGFITAQLNRYQEEEFGELPSFALFGDPAFRLRVEEPPAAPEQRTSGDTISVGNWRTHSLRIELDAERLLAPDERSPGVLCCSMAGRSGAGAEAWLVRQHVDADQVVLKSSEIRQAAAELAAMSAAFQTNVRFLEVLHDALQGQVDGAALEPLSELLGAVREASPVLDNVRHQCLTRNWHAGKVAAVLGHIESALGFINGLNQLVPAAWAAARQWVVVHHHYAHRLDPAGPETGSGRCCPGCGHWMTLRKSVDPAAPSIVRNMFTCIRCGVVADLPEGATVPDIGGPDTAVPGETIFERVTFQADLPSAAKVEVAGYFGGFGCEVVKCQVRPESAAMTRGGDTFEGVLELRFKDDCPPGLYFLVVVASAVLSPVFAGKYVSVKPGRRGRQGGAV